MSERFGPTTPDNDMVICPCCTSQFVAIPVNVQARLAEAEAERDDQIKWASHYAARAARLEAELQHLHQAYANKHSPQHRAAALNSAEGVLRATDSASLTPTDSTTAKGG